MRETLFLLFSLLSVPALAGCIDQGHYAIVAHSGTLKGTPWPYSEDLASRQDQLPVGDPVVIAYDAKLPWTKIQSGCASYAERNVYASEDVSLVLRASFAFSFQSKKTAVTGARYQVQLRLDDRVVLDEVRRLDGRYPQSHRFGTVVADVPRGSYVYSMWFRLLDGPRTNQVTIGLQWITSQGMPNRYPVASASRDRQQRIGTKWQPVSAPLRITTTETSDFILLSTIAADERLRVTFSVVSREQKRPPWQPMIVQDALFDQRLQLPPGTYTIRLWAQALEDEVTVESVRTHVAAFPSDVYPMYQSTAAQPHEVTPSGSAEESYLNPVCGRWTKLLDFDSPSKTGDFSWFLHAYVEFERVVGHGYVEIAIQTVRNQPSHRLGIIEVTDMGISVSQLSPGGDGVSFYGDASSWGNDGGNSMSLWMRIIEGCNDASFGNQLTVGKRWVAVKLLPTTSIHLP
jgi:hypothetical protein